MNAAERETMEQKAFLGAWESLKKEYGGEFQESMNFIERLFPEVKFRMTFILSTIGLEKERMNGIIDAMNYLDERITGLQKTIDTYETALKAMKEE